MHNQDLLNYGRISSHDELEIAMINLSEMREKERWNMRETVPRILFFTNLSTYDKNITITSIIAIIAYKISRDLWVLKI
jgi:hypothetical protein